MKVTLSISVIMEELKFIISVGLLLCYSNSLGELKCCSFTFLDVVVRSFANVAWTVPNI